MKRNLKTYLFFKLFTVLFSQLNSSSQFPLSVFSPQMSPKELNSYMIKQTKVNEHFNRTRYCLHYKILFSNLRMISGVLCKLLKEEKIRQLFFWILPESYHLSNHKTSDLSVHPPNFCTNKIGDLFCELVRYPGDSRASIQSFITKNNLTVTFALIVPVLERYIKTPKY